MTKDLRRSREVPKLEILHRDATALPRYVQASSNQGLRDGLSDKRDLGPTYKCWLLPLEMKLTQARKWWKLSKSAR